MNTPPFSQFNDFVCRHAPEYTNNGVDNFSLYNYAKYTELHSRHKKQNVWADVLPYLRLAAANGDTLANIRLQTYLTTRKTPSELTPNVGKEVLALNDKLLIQELPIAYYRKSRYISMGLYTGSSQDADAYLRRAADLGDKDAQNSIGSRIAAQISTTPQERFPYVLKFLGCASEQGHSEAAFQLFSWLDEKKYPEQFIEKIRYLHLGAKGVTVGSYNLALSTLGRGFSAYEPNRRAHFFNLTEPDIERVRRYDILWEYSHDYSHLNPAFPDLDDIVPLPPAKLPEWDGKSAFQRWYEGPPPPKPSNELVHRLAQQYGLDPTTGLPLKR